MRVAPMPTDPFMSLIFAFVGLTGHDDYRCRESATAVLGSHRRSSAVGMLLEAVAADPEVRKRCGAASGRIRAAATDDGVRGIVGDLAGVGYGDWPWIDSGQFVPQGETAFFVELAKAYTADDGGPRWQAWREATRLWVLDSLRRGGVGAYGRVSETVVKMAEHEKKHLAAYRLPLLKGAK